MKQIKNTIDPKGIMNPGSEWIFWTADPTHTDSGLYQSFTPTRRR